MLWSTAAVAAALPDSLLRELPSRPMKNLQVPRSHHMAFVAGEDIVVVGGHTTGFIPTSTAEYYHGGRWRPIQQLYSHDGGFRVRLADGRWMVAGGFEKYLGIGQSYAVEVYDSTARSFSPLPIMEEKRAMARGISLPDGTVVISGNFFSGDSMETYRPEEGALSERPVRDERMLPFLFRTGDDDVLLLGVMETHGKMLDTVSTEYLKKEGSFSHPLLEQWKPIPFIHTNWVPEDYAIDNTSYLLPAKSKDGKTGILLLRDGDLSLLPTRWDIPEGNPMNPIQWSSLLLVHRDREAALLLGSDASCGFYICRIDYGSALAGGDAPICVYRTTYPVPEFTLDGPAPVLLQDGRLLMIGGRPANNYEPYATVMAFYPFDGPFPGASASILWWIVAAVVLAVAVTGVLVLRHRKQTPREEADPAPDTDRMQRIRDLMETEQLYLKKGLRIDDVAARLASNQKYISACINQNTGKSFTDFVNEYRVRYAQELLTTRPELKIQDIGERAGFTSSVSFHRNFLKLTGKTPAQWREEDSN